MPGPSNEAFERVRLGRNPRYSTEPRGRLVELDLAIVKAIEAAINRMSDRMIERLDEALEARC